ncbi:MAG TPA: 16S rRNA (cytosine(1402)-N(4))-methyltransferase RsmH [Bryobacteraceae bacterium]|jgi:16S rRNA (cytosine1402-N4)-methyltransferase|nr:16S rRNA (cytosine(1402)-N(4))-methyltransferase RsmH [Bryobacteraceae bacterium]
MHYSVMLNECIEYLRVRADGVYLDTTAGLGGHSGAIAARLDTGLLIASDRDAESLALCRENTQAFAARIRYHHGSFSGLRSVLELTGGRKMDGLLADLGVSRYQLTSPERGFSILSDGPADMRMDRSQELTAGDLLNTGSEKDLADLIYQNGEERRSRKIARAIVRARPIHTTGELARVVESVVPRTGRIHPATQTFQALRMAVNAEGEELDALLRHAPELMAPGGRMVILTFMSLEDRKVKRSFQALAREGRVTILTKHVVRPSEEEVRNNPPSRSAKLRAVEMSLQ